MPEALSASAAPGTPRARRSPAGRSRSASAGRRRRDRRGRAGATRAPSSGWAPSASRAWRSRPGGLSRPGRLPMPLRDQTEDLVRRLFDRELGDVDHGAAETTVERLGLLELLVDLGQLRV